MFNNIIGILLIGIFLLEFCLIGGDDDNFKVCPGNDLISSNSKLAKRFQIENNIFACKECDDCKDKKAEFTSDVEKAIGDGGFLEDYTIMKENQGDSVDENCDTLEIEMSGKPSNTDPVKKSTKTMMTVASTKPTPSPTKIQNSSEGMIAFLNVGKVKINNVLVMKDIYFNERFNLTLCSSKATNSCDDQVLEMKYLWKDNNIISSTNNMFKLKENKDKTKNFNILNGATFDLNFVMKENKIIVYFYKDGSRIDLELEYESGSKMDDIEINVVKIEKGSITDETIFNKEIIKIPYSKDLGAENHLKPSNILKFEFEFMKMDKNGIGIILLQDDTGTIKAAKILKTVGEPASLKDFLNKEGENKLHFMLILTFPKEDKEETKTGFVHFITQAKDKGDLSLNVTAVYVKKENKKISIKLDFGGGKSDKIKSLTANIIPDSGSFKIERGVTTIELPKINKIFVVGTEKDVMLLQSSILEPKKMK